jgi:hypothetical protein
MVNGRCITDIEDEILLKRLEVGKQYPNGVLLKNLVLMLVNEYPEWYFESYARDIEKKIDKMGIVNKTTYDKDRKSFVFDFTVDDDLIENNGRIVIIPAAEILEFQFMSRNLYGHEFDFAMMSVLMYYLTQK